jgi:hypothetical protein
MKLPDRANEKKIENGGKAVCITKKNSRNMELQSVQREQIQKRELSARCNSKKDLKTAAKKRGAS